MARSASRIEAVDLARGLALIGMMYTHVGPHWIGENNPPVGDVMAGGRAAPLFAMLAGVALTIVHRRDPRGAGSVWATWIRAVILIALGLALGSLEDVPMFIILAYYGVMIVLVLPFRRLPTWWLIGLAFVWAIVAPVLLLWAQQEKQVFSGQTEWKDLQHPGELFMEIFVWGVYPVGVWIAYALIGMAIGRLDLRNAVTAWRLVAAGSALVVSTLAAGMVAIRSGRFDDLKDGSWQVLFVGPSYPDERPTGTSCCSWANTRLGRSA